MARGGGGGDIIEAIEKTAGRTPVHMLLRDVFGQNTTLAKRYTTLQKHGHTVWSFDPEDCARYGFSRYQQYIGRIRGMEATPVKRDFSFIGANKGRERILSAIAGAIREQNLDSAIDIRYKADESARTKRRNHLPYLRYLQFLCSAKCVIDVVAEWQSGMTLRPVEAMFYRRKLISNCESVRQMPFYRPENIIVFQHPDELSGYDLARFVNAPFVDVAESDLRMFTLEYLLEQIVKTHERKYQ